MLYMHDAVACGTRCKCLGCKSADGGSAGNGRANLYHAMQCMMPMHKRSRYKSAGGVSTDERRADLGHAVRCRARVQQALGLPGQRGRLAGGS